MAETTKSIKYSDKYSSDYLANENGDTIFLQPTDQEKIANITSSLNSNKASGTISIPYRILCSNWEMYSTSLSWEGELFASY